MRKLFGFFVVLMGVLVFVAIPWAADWNFSGSARVATFWDHRDYGNNEVTLDNGQTIKDDDDLQWDFTPESRIETKVEADKVKGHIELGLKGDGENDVDDTASLMWSLIAGYKVSDALNLEAGYGWRQEHAGCERAQRRRCLIPLRPGRN
jgi:hypothetical protein